MTFRLEATLVLPDGRVGLALEPGQAAITESSAVVRALVGEDRERRHRIVLDGQRLDRRRPAGRVRRGLGVVSGAPVAASVSIHDHLAAIAGRRGAATILADAPLLAGRGGEAAGILSGGERLVLAWLRAVATRPRAMVLDGAGAGADAEVLRWMEQQVARWRAEGVVVVIRPSRPEERAWAGARTD